EARRTSRQRKSQQCPAARCLLDPDRAAVRLDDPLRDVEPETGAAATARAAPELREDASLRLRWNAFALVGDGDDCAVVVRPDRHSDGAGAVPERVLDEIADDLRELVRVDPHLRQLAGGIHPEAVRR